MDKLVSKEGTENPFIQLENISMYFPGVKALDKVSFSLNKGECMALVGENGAGKSTLCKVILGIYTPTEGAMYIAGEEVIAKGYTIKDSKKYGIEAVHQELQLVPELNAIENIFLGLPRTKFGFSNFKEMKQEAIKLMEFLDVQINLDVPIKQLRMAEKQIIQLAKALITDAKVIILDELTAVLQEKDIQNIFRIIERLKANGISIIYISHRLDEIFEVCERYTVLVDGTMSGTGYVSDITKDQLIEKIIGRELSQVFPTIPSLDSNQEVMLEVDNLTSDAFKNIKFQLKKGEIIGFAGLVGAGKTEILNAIFGNYPYVEGTIKVKGKKQKFRSPRDAVKNGVALVPDERKSLGFANNFSIKHNMSLGSLEKFYNFFLNAKKETEVALEYAKKMELKYANLNQMVAKLSGGNQQKIVIAKWLIADSEIFLFDEPTRGIDIGAKSEIYKLITNLAQEGKSIIIVSPELEELIGLCHRIHILFEGEIKKTVSGDEKTQENIISSLLGVSS